MTDTLENWFAREILALEPPIFIGARGDVAELNVLVDVISPEHCTTNIQELQRLTLAFDHLPPQCRDVVGKATGRAVQPCRYSPPHRPRVTLEFLGANGGRCPISTPMERSACNDES